MKKNSALFLIALSILFLQGCHGRSNPMNSGKFVPGEAIVKFKPQAFNEKGGLSSKSINSLNAKYGLISMNRVFENNPSGDLTYIYKLKFHSKIDITKIVKEYKKDPSVVYAEPNYIAKTQIAPAEPY